MLCDRVPRYRLLKRELNKQERASDTGMKSVAMGVIPFTINDDLRLQLQAFGNNGGGVNWIEMVCTLFVFPHFCLPTFLTIVTIKQQSTNGRVQTSQGSKGMRCIATKMEGSLRRLFSF